jgi:hypothetical protein
MSFNAKIRSRAGVKGKSKYFMVVENFRRKIDGKNVSREVLYFGTLKFEQWINKFECQKFWDKIEPRIDAAVSAGKIPAREVQKVKDKLKKGLGLLTDAERAERQARLIARYPILDTLLLASPLRD